MQCVDVELVLLLANLGMAYGQDAIVNLGWCNTMRNVESVMHEFGHILGMPHTQERPDAQVH